MIFADEAKMSLAHYKNGRCWREKLRATPWRQESHHPLLKILNCKYQLIVNLDV